MTFRPVPPGARGFSTDARSSDWKKVPFSPPGFNPRRANSRAMKSPAHRSPSLPARRPFNPSSARYLTAEGGSDKPLVTGPGSGHVWEETAGGASRRKPATAATTVGMTGFIRPL
jgi:hypothetical protein